jgi:flagellar basal body-associated protein FliL
MSNSIAEVYFIVAMMILIMILCVAAVYIFFRQLKREKGEREKFTSPKKVKKDESEPE